MATNDDRREVARKLRGNPEDTHIPHRTGRHYGMWCHEAADRFWNMCYRIREAGNYDIAFSTTSVLADLIEPEPERTCRDTSPMSYKFTCSECHSSYRFGSEHKVWYCPYCGAKVVSDARD